MDLEVISNVSVLVCVADIAMQYFANERHTTGATSVFQHSGSNGLWHDDARRAPFATTMAHAARVHALGFSGGQGQRVTLGDQIANQSTFCADQLLLWTPRQRKPIGRGWVE